MLASANELARWAFFATVAVLMIVGTVGFWASSKFTKPLISLASLMGFLNSGETNFEIPELERKDEIGSMARALEAFRQSAIEKVQMSARKQLPRILRWKGFETIARRKNLRRSSRRL